MNNYAHNFGSDNFGSSPTECLSRYRGTEALSEPETAALVSLFEIINSPTLIVGIESGGHSIKYPYNYANDANNTVVKNSDFAWFYNSIDRDVPTYDESIPTGNYLSLHKFTNNGDNDDYFRGIKNTMAYTWTIGSQNYTNLYLNQTNSQAIKEITENNLDLALYAIQKAGEQIKVVVDHFDV